MIAIVHDARDPHIRVIAQRLAQKGTGVFVADPSELGAGAEITFDPKSADLFEWQKTDGTRLRSSEVSALWFRPGTSPTIHAELHNERAYVAREWHELVRAVVTSLDVPTLNPVEAQIRATKPYQLVAARRAGLDVPETIITNSATRAIQLVATGGPVVHKTLIGMGRTLATKAWGSCEQELRHELVLAPTILQRRVSGNREVRVTAVGERLFAAEFSSALVDGRLDHARSHSRHELPASIARSLLALLHDLGLSFASIDLRIDDSGNYKFLEVNPSCAFLWIEVETGMPISAAVADLLSSMRRS